uniref:PWI domain-containing protein n=1 Tax=Toxoplasma gondii TgCATBr9 TaxID=943120 RepID=A0A2T6J3F3_TOXGO|nr:PWI domain-containing protein [Toxoplasma gondii TgCATBr9]
MRSTEGRKMSLSSAVWWEGLQEPRRRQERKRRRRREAEDDAADRDEEEKELREEAKRRREDRSRASARQEGEGDASAASIEQGRDARERSQRCAAPSSPSLRHRDARKQKEQTPSFLDEETAAARHEKSRETRKEETSRSDRDARRVKTELKTSAAQTPSQELRAFFGDDEEGFDDRRRHKPLTKLDEHRDVTNKMQKAQETLKVIEQSKKLLASVPTEKEKLFVYDIDWSLLISKNILDLKLRPWVRKKVCEFMGAEESLVLEVIDYIVKRVSDRPPAEELLGELAKFLDEEAEGFVRNMWRLLIYEQLKLKECSE